jgi:hypothetical protein
MPTPRTAVDGYRVASNATIGPITGPGVYPLLGTTEFAIGRDPHALDDFFAVGGTASVTIASDGSGNLQFDHFRDSAGRILAVHLRWSCSETGN